MRRGRLAALGRLMAVAALAVAAPGRAQPTEDAVKAAFLPKFARYATWPASAQPDGIAPFVLCLVGGDPFGKVIDQAAASETVDGHPVTVRRLAGTDGAAGCHIAFVAASNEKHAGELMGALDRLPILTITDARSGATHAIIHFVLIRGRVRFTIDDAAAAARGIAINSRLLALAVSVKQRP